jgi:enoyl-CoA hydratase/carnithine racemase
VTDLREAVNEISRERGIRVVVLRGAGRGFCAGADLKGDDVRVPGTEEMGELGFIYKMQQNLAETILALHECEKPMLTGRHFDAAEALRIGMLHAVVPEAGLFDAALEKAREIAANSEYGVWMTKRGLATNLDAPSLRHAIELENRQQVLGTFTGNMLEAMHAFQQKRPPRWKPL